MKLFKFSNERPNHKHHISFDAYLESALVFGTVIGIDTNVRPTEYIFQLAIICIVFTIRIR
jgi:hypothetical protein